MIVFLSFYLIYRLFYYLSSWIFKKWKWEDHPKIKKLEICKKL